MSSGKQSPRQKMINMMYLVLIALLALNVSAEILKAFYLVEVSMLKSGKNIDDRNKAILGALQKAVEKEPAKAQPFLTAAQEVDKKVKDYVKNIETIKLFLETETGGRFAKGETGEGQLQGRDNMEKHANYFINEGHGAELKKKVIDLNAELSAIVKKQGIDSKNLLSFKEIEAKDNTENGHTWESELFEHSPLAAVITLLTKMQNDAKNAGSEAMAELALKINAADFKFDQLVAKVIPKSTMVLEGEKFEAEVILTAYNSKDQNVMTVSGAPIKVENGVGKFEQTSSVGEHKYKGAIIVKKPEGGTEEKTFEGEYIGFKASATISADKMNVLYIGLENPITVGVSGARAEDVECSFPGATARKVKPGQYMVEVGAGVKEVKATATVKGKAMGSMTFRIKSVPKPFPLFGNKESGRIAPGEVNLQTIIWAGLGPEFLFDGMRYTVTKYTLVYTQKRQDPKFFTVTGQAISQQIKDAMRNPRSGDQIQVSGIEAMGPGKVGLVRLSSAIALTVQ
ncbi:MAG: gliding motility protein GldM [Bacteroidota bacterium]|nr:gliding motility protein GldM [Bacteroidota bacterium]